MGSQHQDNGTLTAKVAARYRLHEHLRLELGVGAADDSLGKSLNGDFGATLGTTRPDATWNYYLSLRIAGARGFPGTACCGGGATGDEALPDALFALGSIGAMGRIGPNQQFIFEGGYGNVWVRGNDEVGRMLYLGAGLLFDIGKAHKPPRTRG